MAYRFTASAIMGRSFTEKSLLKMNGVNHVRVAPYHAASNGKAERMVQSFKNHMKVCNGSKLSIQQRIENFLLTYGSTKHPTTGRTPTSLFCKLRTRLSPFIRMWERSSWIPRISRRQHMMCTRGR